MEYLGFIIDSENMITYLSDKKKKKINDKWKVVCKKQDLKIRDITSFIGALAFIKMTLLKPTKSIKRQLVEL